MLWLTLGPEEPLKRLSAPQRPHAFVRKVAMLCHSAARNRPRITTLGSEPYSMLFTYHFEPLAFSVAWHGFILTSYLQRNQKQKS